MVRDGWILAGPIAGLTLFFVLLGQWIPDIIWIPLAVVSGGLGIFICFFFRNPVRNVPEGENLVISAADGKVVGIEDVEDEAFMGGRATQISVFLSIFNVHVNRAPVSGTIKIREQKKGVYGLAYKVEASQENEQLVLGIESKSSRVVVKQIVGYIARRIVCHVGEGDTVQAGQLYGLIRFGSRVDVVVPHGTSINAKIGDKVKGGETILGVLQ